MAHEVYLKIITTPHDDTEMRTKHILVHAKHVLILTYIHAYIHTHIQAVVTFFSFILRQDH